LAARESELLSERELAAAVHRAEAERVMAREAELERQREQDQLAFDAEQAAIIEQRDDDTAKLRKEQARLQQELDAVAAERRTLAENRTAAESVPVQGAKSNGVDPEEHAALLLENETLLLQADQLKTLVHSLSADCDGLLRQIDQLRRELADARVPLVVREDSEQRMHPMPLPCICRTIPARPAKPVLDIVQVAEAEEMLFGDSPSSTQLYGRALSMRARERAAVDKQRVLTEGQTQAAQSLAEQRATEQRVVGLIRAEQAALGPEEGRLGAWAGQDPYGMHIDDERGSSSGSGGSSGNHSRSYSLERSPSFLVSSSLTPVRSPSPLLPPSHSRASSLAAGAGSVGGSSSGRKSGHHSRMGSQLMFSPTRAGAGAALFGAHGTGRSGAESHTPQHAAVSSVKHPPARPPSGAAAAAASSATSESSLLPTGRPRRASLELSMVRDFRIVAALGTKTTAAPAGGPVLGASPVPHHSRAPSAQQQMLLPSAASSTPPQAATPPPRE
jgi:hypothetical protein